MRKTLFERIRKRVSCRDTFFVQRSDATGKLGATSYQKVTAALRMLAYGTSADQLDDSIRLSETTILLSLRRFCEAIVQEFGTTYLRRPTEQDLKLILKLSQKSGWIGCLGSLDVMKWEWKNCPIAWRGVFKSGKDKYPTIGLEAVVDCRLWFWHSFFGFPGTQNDINILDQSNLFEAVVNGVAPAVHFVVNKNVYEMGYYLTDGIYPPWQVLMQTISLPIGRKEQQFAKLQEAKRKEIERAFGVLQVSLGWLSTVICFFILSRNATITFLFLLISQARWRIVATPCRLWSKDAMSIVMSACIILHNMIIEDEWEDPSLTHDFVFQDNDGSMFQVDRLYKDTTSHLLGSVDVMEARRRYKNQDNHKRLKQDLVQHLWDIHGNQEYNEATGRVV